MRIAEIATLGRPVPPTGEGSVELLVSLQTEELVNRGHEVTLFALPSSRTAARLESPVKSSYADGVNAWDWQVYESFQVREAFRQWRDFDIIHCHSYHFGMLYCDFVPIPSLHSIHIEPGPDYLFLAQNTRNRHLHFCSQYQARDFSGVANTHVIPHG
ncbi:MAG: glycosyltransferase, partial [Candidatus Sumerlaeia bacterium]|nr:glycosyltransferase [Candidatus Sumerlaeia bacterium]